MTDSLPPRLFFLVFAQLTAAAFTVCIATPVRAQRSDTVCAQGRISNIFIDNHSIFDLSDPDLNPRLGWAYRLANNFHAATRQNVIRRELLFQVDDCYNAGRLDDSERLLRALDFIAGVDIYGIRQADGSVHVLVDTQDEWSLRLEPQVGGGGASSLRGVRLREDNLLGSAIHLSSFYVRSQDARVYGGRFFTPQFIGTRWDAELQAGKTPVGYLFNESLTYPFVGETGRWAMRQAVLHDEHYFEFLVPEGNDLQRIWFPEQRISFEFGGAVRFGKQRFSHTMVGASLTGEWTSYPTGPRFADQTQVPFVKPPLLGIPLDSISSVRAMFFLGQRNVYYVRRKSLDTVNGIEDVRLGVEAEVALGPSIPGLSRGRDLAVDFGLFAGGEMQGLGLAGLQFQVEARRDYQSAATETEWNNIFAQLNAWSYLRVSPDSRGALVAAVSAAGAWHERTPFQLTLGASAGLRGYRNHLDPGGRRVVASLEERRYLGWPYPELFDLGAVAFLDVGKMWAGDAPFGLDSPVRADAGLGIRVAFPPGSRQTLRLDVGAPLSRGLRARDIVVSIGIGQLIGVRSVGVDPQMARSTRLGSSTSMFVFPRSERE